MTPALAGVGRNTKSAMELRSMLLTLSLPRLESDPSRFS